MKKIKVDVIYNEIFIGYDYKIKFSDLPKDILDTDIIDIQRHEAFHSDYESYDDFTNLVIYVKV